jgi:hypothetical protein
MGQAPEELSCARCEQNKPLSGFAIRTLKGVVRYHSYCKDCENKYARDFRAKDREATKKKDRAYYKANRERILASSRRYRVETGFNRKQHLKRYNLTPDEYQVLLVKQNGVCAICRRPPWGKRNVLMVDHDHETGKVRGLLCSTCNVGLGALHDDAELLRVAIAYLEGG